MTQPDGFTPTGAANYDSFAGYAATTQQDWENQINNQWLSTLGPLSGICALFGQLPFLDGLAAYGGYPGSGNLVESSLHGIQLFADGLCGLATGNQGLSGTTPTTVVDGVVTVMDAAGNNSLFTQILGLGGGSGNMFVDLLDGVTSLVNSLLALIGGDPFTSTAALFDTLTGWLSDIPIIGDIIAMITEAITGILGGSTLDLSNWFTDLLGLLGSPFGLGTGSPSTFIPNGNVAGLLGPAAIGDAIQAFVDALFGGFTNQNASGIQLGFLADAVRGVSQQSGSSLSIAESLSAMFARRPATRPTYIGVDPSADAVFHLQVITATTATFVNVPAGNSVIGFIGTPDAGVKKSIAWLGKDTGSITGMYINLWKMNTVTGVIDLLHNSADIHADVSNSLTWNYYNFPDETDWITSAQGDWYGVEMQVTGAGTYHIVGLPSHWLDPNGNAYPQAMAATRSSPALPPPSTVSSPTYSANVPWFALTGAEGISAHGAETTVFNANGTYTIPSWAVYLDFIAVGGGGGGEGGGLAWGEGGDGGHWNATTLTRGVHIPTATTSLTVTVGAGGAAGGGFSINGGTGGTSSVAGTGYGGLSATGGAGGSASNASYGGGSPGNYSYRGILYTGGAGSGGSSGNGQAPGGGGGGSIVVFSSAGAGAHGAVWIVARQGST